MPKFDEDENKQLDKEIRSTVINMTDKLKKCEDSIKEMLVEQTKSSVEDESKFSIKLLNSQEKHEAKYLHKARRFYKAI